MIDKTQVKQYLDAYPGDLVCAIQVWYEGLLGHGVMSPEQKSAMDEAIGSSAGWTDAGDVRYEKFGVQKSFKRA